MNNLNQSKINVKNILIFLTSIFMMSLVTTGYAADTLGDMATSIYDSLKKFENVIGTGSYIVGLAFAIGAIMKFKQHKDNPSNIPIGTPIALLFVAVALVFLPSLISITGTTAKLSETAKEGGFNLN